MLPFTKRPGRGGDDAAVVTKEDSPKSASLPPPASNVKRSLPPPPISRPELDDDEMTSVLPSRSYTGPIPPNKVLPAAGTPAVPPSSRSRPGSLRPLPQTVPPPASSARAAAIEDDDDDDDGGRTVVRGAPKIVRRTNAGKSMQPASISPAAVIKATLESARANRRELLPGPPPELLEDRSDFDRPDAYDRKDPFEFDRKDQLEFDRDLARNDPHDVDRDHGAPAPMQTERQQPAAFARTLPASVFENPANRPPLEGPPSYPPSANYGQPMHAPVSVKPVGGAYGSSPQVGQAVPAAPPSVPAHFMTPQAPYSADPPGTAVTSSSRVAGRPAISWAAALLACGLFVGVAAVAVMQSSESVADTTASFVDPSRAPRSNTAQQQQQQQQAQPTPVPVAATAAPGPVADPSSPAGLLGASPVPVPPAAPSAPPEAVAAVPPIVTAPMATAPVVATAPVLPAPIATAPAVAPQGTVVGGFAPVAVAPAPEPAPQPQAAPKKPAWNWRPPAPAPAAPKPVAKAVDDSPKKEAKAPPKAASEKPSKKSANNDADDETRKALEALQKAQLESANSFGND